MSPVRTALYTRFWRRNNVLRSFLHGMLFQDSLVLLCLIIPFTQFVYSECPSAVWADILPGMRVSVATSPTGFRPSQTSLPFLLVPSFQLFWRFRVVHFAYLFLGVYSSWHHDAVRIKGQVSHLVQAAILLLRHFLRPSRVASLLAPV